MDAGQRANYSLRGILIILVTEDSHVRSQGK